MMEMKKLGVLLLVLISGAAFTTIVKELNDEKPVYIPGSPQRLWGDSAKGYEYLTTGNYVKGGIPYSIFVFGIGKNKTNFLNRSGKNEKISHEYTAVAAPNGELLVAPNCLQCHAQVFNDQLYIGLGNSFIDFSAGQKLNLKNLERVENFLRTTSPRKYEASASFITVAKTIGPYLKTEVRGVNSADRLAAVLAAHRDPVSFKWIPEPLLELPNEVIPSDVPAWWLLKKKNAMFYNGFGRGDFGKFLMASNLLTVNDTSESKEVDQHMPDVLAYLFSLRPPPYPNPINKQLAEEGEIVFYKNCSGCHGTYGEKEQYPNLLIPSSVIQTDSTLCKSNYSNPQFIEWFNKSWFTQGQHPARLQPFNGYIAPPLDGIWVTAPFLHNGSIPTLEALLNSTKRPTYWERDFENPIYDFENVGWRYKTHLKPGGKTVYNTDLPGYGNYGHFFGDKLNDVERKAVIEYLKTL
jgi:mono/diheme cytochrome c family protein